MKGPESTANQSNSTIWPELWAAFANHRDTIMQIVRNLSRGPQSTLCVLGSGRTTDLDLIELSQHFAKIDLIDLEPSLTQAALQQRGFSEQHHVRALGGIDVTGLETHWTKFRNSPTEDSLKEIIEACNQSCPDLDQYDVVASTCLLTQIIRHAFETIEKSGLPPAIAENYLPQVIRAIREQHIGYLLDHSKAGGSAILITDLTSSDALPEMLLPNADLNQLMSTKVTQGNHFHGINPTAILGTTQLPRITAKIAHLQATAPWIWNSIESQYLCVAFRFQRK